MTDKDDANTERQTEGNQDIPPAFVDQYKTYVDTTLNVSNRRLNNNRFYVVLLSGTLAVVSVLAETQIIEEAGLLLAGLLGLALCILWYLSIISYKQLNKGKYQVVIEMEEELPFAPFRREWEILDEGDDWKTYITHTRVERKIPGVLAIPYLIIIGYALYNLC